MTAHKVPVLSLVWLLPLLGSMLCRLLPEHHARTARRLAILTAILTSGLSLWIFVLANPTGTFGRSDDPVLLLFQVLRYHVGVDGLSALLLPATSAVSLCVLLAVPRAELPTRTTAQALFSLSAVLGALVSLDVLQLVLFWILSLLPLGTALRRQGSQRARVAYNLMMAGSSLPLVLAVVVLAWSPAAVGSATGPRMLTLIDLARPVALSSVTATVAGSLILLGTLVRIGCFPLHLWIAPLSESGPSALSMITFSTPLGIFVVARVLLPVFPGLCQQVFPVLLPLGLITACYGAIVALGQHDLRRALGFFWISQQGFLLSGLSSLTPEGLSGALLHAIETVVARTGLLLLATAIAARAGTTDVRFLGGLVSRAPRMATGFVLLSAAAIGLPGTTGFVSEDLIVQGLLRAHGLLAAVLLVATALNGILLFRLFQRVFLGEPSPHQGALHLREFTDLLRRERWVSVALVFLLLVGGLLASPLLAVRQSVLPAPPHSPGDTGTASPKYRVARNPNH